MDAALSSAVSESLSTQGSGNTDSQVRLSLEEMESVLRHWESIDSVKWDDETRLACSESVEREPWSVAEWKERLVKVPSDVEDRYRKVMKLLLDKKLIDPSAFDVEIEVMTQFSPATLARRGKLFADWYRKY